MSDIDVIENLMDEINKRVNKFRNIEEIEKQEFIKVMAKLEDKIGDLIHGNEKQKKEIEDANAMFDIDKIRKNLIHMEDMADEYYGR